MEDADVGKVSFRIRLSTKRTIFKPKLVLCTGKSAVKICQQRMIVAIIPRRMCERVMVVCLSVQALTTSFQRSNRALHDIL